MAAAEAAVVAAAGEVVVLGRPGNQAVRARALTLAAGGVRSFVARRVALIGLGEGTA